MSKDLENSAGAGLAKTRWFIDLGWYDRARRSFYFVAQVALCPKCRKRLRNNRNTPSEKILATIMDCCSNSADFITPRLPLLEGAFRILLANGNEPLDTSELVNRLNERYGGYSYAAETLEPLLARDDFYGFSKLEA